jgi:hypothetical protein
MSNTVINADIFDMIIDMKTIFEQVIRYILVWVSLRLKKPKAVPNQIEHIYINFFHNALKSLGNCVNYIAIYNAKTLV